MYRGIVDTVIKAEQLPLYEQAAQTTGYGLTVTVKEGQPHTFWYDENKGYDEFGRIQTEQSGWRTITIGKGNLGIQITKPEDQKDHSAFWDEFKKLKAEQNSSK